MDAVDIADCERFVLGEVAELLGVPEVCPDDSFVGLHGDSLKAILLTTAIEDRFGVVIDVADAFAAESFRAFCAQIAQAARTAGD